MSTKKVKVTRINAGAVAAHQSTDDQATANNVDDIESKVYKLKNPITLPDGEVIRELILRHIKVKEMKAVNYDKAMREGGLSGMCMLLSIMCKVPVVTFDDMSISELHRIIEEAEPFLPVGHGETGRN